MKLVNLRKTEWESDINDPEDVCFSKPAQEHDMSSFWGKYYVFLLTGTAVLAFGAFAKLVEVSKSPEAQLRGTIGTEKPVHCGRGGKHAITKSRALDCQ